MKGRSPNLSVKPQSDSLRSSSGKINPERDIIEDTIRKAQENLLTLQRDGEHWNFHAHLGLHFISQYFLFNKWFGHSHTRLDQDRLINLILEDQTEDGSWMQIQNSSQHPGDINATIFNYWALKASGFDINDEVMIRARQFILAQGGIESAALFTKIILALFNNFSWCHIPYTPYIIFNEKMPLNHKDFSQWAIPHLMAIAYLRNNFVSKSLGPLFELRELWVREPKIDNSQFLFKPLAGRNKAIVQKILADQQPKGSWGGYTLSTLLSMMALDDFSKRGTKLESILTEAIVRGFHFVEELYFGAGDGAYKGALMDGKFWDTILVGHSLLASGVEDNLVKSAAQYILETQQANGGFPYGEDFEYAPDVDDTAEAILFLLRFPGEYRDELARSISWICSMQNKDGGWGAFERNNEGKPLLRFLTREFQDSVDLFDDSSADLTGHILEALGATGLDSFNSEIVRKAISYLKKNQDDNGGWIGRWGINYLYGTACALTGLFKVGESPQEPYIKKSLEWLVSRQNPDGGFGESPDSYKDPTVAGVGRSTPSQTAWVLITLCCGGLGLSSAATRAAGYLISEFKEEGRWVDRSVVGTGHPGILYMNYPSYQYTFPLFGLSAYLECLIAKEHDRNLLK